MTGSDTLRVRSAAMILFLIFEVATDAKVPPNERAQQQE
jgi:hypothetical protein